MAPGVIELDDQEHARNKPAGIPRAINPHPADEEMSAFIRKVMMAGAATPATLEQEKEEGNGASRTAGLYPIEEEPDAAHPAEQEMGVAEGIEDADEFAEAALQHPGRERIDSDPECWWSGEHGSKFNVSRWRARGTTNVCLLATLAGEAEFRLGRSPKVTLAPIGTGPFGNYPGIADPAMEHLVKAEFDWYERVHMAEPCPRGTLPGEFVHVVSPWNSVWKPGREGEAVRPVFDTSASGLNDCLLQLPINESL